MSVCVCQRCHNKFRSNEGRYAQNYLLGGLTSYSTKEWYCYSCVQSVEAEMKAAKKAAKAAKKAERDSEDEDYESSSSESGPTLPSGCSAVLGKLVTGILILLGLIVVYVMIFGPKPENVNDKEQMMKLWGEHLEKRCAAFAEGLSEESVEARGLKNYTWDEWMDFKRKGQKVSETQSTKPSEPSLHDQWLAHMDKRSKMSASGMATTEIDNAGYPNLTFDEFKEFKKKKAEEAELKRLNARLAELEGKVQTGGQQKASTSMTEGPKPVTSQREDGLPSASVGGNPQKGAASGQPGAASGRATKDSKGIRIVVKGKGKAEEAALQNALHQAVWKAVSTWVDSKTRIGANRKEVIAIVETVTEADVGKCEVMSTEREDEGFVVTARVSVSKQKIAPKFAKLFPDVFANDVK